MLTNFREYSIECSFNLHKKTFGVTFKNRVSKAIKEIRKFSKKLTKVNTIRIDPSLNKFLCKGGSKRVPNRIRIRLSKRRYLVNDDSENWIVFVNFIKKKSIKNISPSTFSKVI